MNVKKLILAFAILILAFAILPLPIFAQAPLTSTTLTSSMTSSSTLLCVASSTSIVTPNLPSGQVGSYLLIDTETVQVVSAAAQSLCYNVHRGLFPALMLQGATNHGNGAKVWVMGPTISTGDPSRPTSTAAFLGTRSFQPFYAASTPTLFGVAATSVTDVNGKFFISAIEIDNNSIFTGACWLNGATVTTDKHLAVLWDATGTVIASSALAGVSDSGNASIYQCVAFTSPVALLGPAEYFVGVQGNGTTDNVQMYNTGAHNYPTTSQTGTFGTLANIATVPVTFTAAVGPFMILYQ